MTKRLCRRCLLEKPMEDFFSHKPSTWCKPCHRKYVMEWRAKNPGKIKAHKKVAWALKHGILNRPDVCSKCFKKTTVVAHHSDYRSPLKVEWVCDSCHIKIHRPFQQGTAKIEAAARRNGKLGGRPKGKKK